MCGYGENIWHTRKKTSLNKNNSGGLMVCDINVLCMANLTSDAINSA